MKVNTQFKLQATPEKIYVMLKLLQINKYTKEQIQHLIQPNQNTDYETVLSYITECGWAKKDANGRYILEFDEAYLVSISTFRKYINRYLFQGDKTWYFEFTKWYLKQQEDILQYTLEEVKKNNPQFLEEGKANDFLAWRLWSSFLGFGNLQNQRFIPNPYIRILDIIEMNQDIEVNTSIPFADFIKWLVDKCPELDGCVEGKELSVFLSLALRVIHDQGIFKLTYQQDSTDIWQLNPNAYHEITGKVTHIEIKEVSHE